MSSLFSRAIGWVKRLFTPKDLELSGDFVYPILRVIDSDRNSDTPYFHDMRGKLVAVKKRTGPYVSGLILESGLPFDGWLFDRLEPLEDDQPKASEAL